MTDDISKVVREMRASSDAVDWKLSEWADRIECDIKKAREQESMPREVRQAWEKAWADRLESATTPQLPIPAQIGSKSVDAGPVEVGDRHVRHEGGGVIALYEGDQRIREIGVAFTTGWDFRDRDEFIVRYNEHATLARQLAEAKAAQIDAERGTASIAHKLNAAESHLAEATRRLGEVEGLLRECQRRLGAEESLRHMTYREWSELDDRIDAALTKEPTK